MAKQIQMHVTPEGEITITTSGFKGSECLKATAALEKALGKKTSDQPTAEMKQQEARQNAGTSR
jgi:hypothetical protein